MWSLDFDRISRLHCTQHAYCNYGVKIPGTNKLSMRTLQFASNFSMNDCRECRCGQPLRDHGHASASRKVTALHEQQMLQQVLQVSVLAALELSPSKALPQTTVNSSEGDAKDGSSSCLRALRARARALTVNNPHRVLQGRIQLHVPTTVRSTTRI